MTTNGTPEQVGYNKIVSWIQSIVQALFATPGVKDTQDGERLEFDTARATRLFAQALHENSNLELDWLWYAANMTRDVERRYCIERALEINPHSSLARGALSKLPSSEAAGESIALGGSPAAPAYESGPRS